MILGTRPWRIGMVLGAVAAGTVAMAVPVNAGTAAASLAGPASVSLPGLQVAGLAVDPNTGIAYIAADGPAGSVLAVSVATGKVVATIHVGGTPGPVAVGTGEIIFPGSRPAAGAVGDTVFVGDRKDGTVTTIDGATDTVTGSIALPVAGAEPTALAMDTSTSELFVGTTSKNGGNVYGISMVPNSPLVTISTAGSTSVTGLALNPVTGILYAAFKGAPRANAIISFAAATDSITRITSLSGGPEAIALNPAASALYVARDGDRVDAFNTRNGARIGTVAVRGIPWSLAANPATGTVYYSNEDSPAYEAISLINGAAKAIAGTIPVAGRGWVGVDPFTDRLVFAGIGTKGSFVSVFSLKAPAISSANHATFRHGRHGSFTVRTSGLPAASVTEAGKLPPGVRFRAGTNGTATIAGTPATLAKGKTYVITLTAKNGVGKAAAQRFTLKVS
jgi:hypothetical protein